MFEAELKFPRDYPLSPPKVRPVLWWLIGWRRGADGVGPVSQMKFNPPLFHPNSALLHLCRATDSELIPYATVYASGDVCISILHAPGDDPNSYESASERYVFVRWFG